MKYSAKDNLCQELAKELNMSPRALAFYAQKIHNKSGSCSKSDLIEKIKNSDFIKNPNPTSAKLNPKPSSKSFVILLVEDSPIVQKVHFLILQNLGCAVDVANDGTEALAKLTKSYDLILMDIGLPGMSGIEIALKIRQQQAQNKRTPIIALTAFGESVKNECYQAGIDDFATKPVLETEFKRLLKKWLPTFHPAH